MKRKQKILVSAITTLLGGTALSMSASAFIDITGSNTSVQTATYASEIKQTSTLEYVLPPIKVNLGGPVSSTTVAIPAGETRYVRVDLLNATIGTTAPNLTGWNSPGGLTASGSQTITSADCPVMSEQTGSQSATIPAGDIAIAQAGAGQGFVIFSVKSTKTDATGLYSAGCTIGIDLHRIKVTTPGQPVFVTYALYSGPIAASNGTIADTRGMSKDKVQVVGFSPALSFKTNSAGKDAVASVEQQFRLFKKTASNSSADGKTASAGAFDLTTNANVLPATGGTAISSVGMILDNASTKLKVEGDFSSIWASGTAATATLSADPKCGNPIVTGTWEKNTAGVPIAATFTNVTNLSGPTYFCLTLGEKNPTPVSSTGVQIASTVDNFKLTLLPVAMSGYDVANKQVDLKKITRDGVTLESPFLNQAPGYTSRVVLSHLNAKSSDDVPFFITLRSDDGNQFTQKLKEGTLKKGTTLKIMSTDLFTPATGAKTRVGVTVTFYGANDDIQAVVQHINSTTGEVTSIPMIRPGGGRGE